MSTQDLVHAGVLVTDQRVKNLLDSLVESVERRVKRVVEGSLIPKNYAPEITWFSDDLQLELIEESSSDSQFFQGRIQLTVEGYFWYRAYRLKLQHYPAELILYTPWVFPQITRAPLLFVQGKVDDDVVLRFVQVYHASLLN